MHGGKGGHPARHPAMSFIARYRGASVKIKVDLESQKTYICYALWGGQGNLVTRVAGVQALRG